MDNIHDEILFNYSAGILCGVLITENVMKKMAALQAKHLDAVKRLLLKEADDDNVFSSMWTLHYPDEEQTSVYYIDKSKDVKEAIRNAVTANQPKPMPLVFIASSMDEAEQLADKRFADVEGLLEVNNAN